MEYIVKLGVEHLKRSSKTNFSEALKQIVWNSIDADSNNIYIKFLRENEIDDKCITKIVVKDDGNGLNINNIDKSLTVYGESEKSSNLKSPGGRNYHGKLGEGRYTYYSLGNYIKWISCYQENDVNYKYEIVFGNDTRTKIQVNDKVVTNDGTGMTVEIELINLQASDYLNNAEKVYKDLVLEFAPYLLAYPSVKIYLEDVEIKIKDFINTECEYSNEDIKSKIKIIKWKDINSKELFICGENDVVYTHYVYDEIYEKDMSVYVSSQYFDDFKLHNEIEVWNSTDIGIRIECFVKDSLLDFIDKNTRNNNIEIIEKLKENDAYPFDDKKILTIEEESQKKLFDIVAVEIVKKAPSLVKTNKLSQKLTFNLINETLNSNPSNLKKILIEVLKLSPSEQDEFAKLLDKTTLSAIISTMSEVENRISFLEELNELVYGGLGKNVKERTQFQKLLLSQLWIFGDKYKYGADDVNLRSVLKAYISHLGREDIFLTDEDKNNTDFNKIPDIVLWNNQKVGDIFENLVVEIKRPTKVLGNEELTQIKNYAYSIIDDARFFDTKTQWRFILIGQKYNKFIEKEIEANPEGIKVGNCVIEIMSWAKLIETNKLRYNYFKEKAKIQLDESKVKESLNNRWKALLGDKAPK